MPSSARPSGTASPCWKAKSWGSCPPQRSSAPPNTTCSSTRLHTARSSRTNYEERERPPFPDRGDAGDDLLVQHTHIAARPLISLGDERAESRLEVRHLAARLFIAGANLGPQALPGGRKFGADLFAELQDLQLLGLHPGRQFFQRFHFFFENLHSTREWRWWQDPAPPGRSCQRDAGGRR